LCGRSCFRPGCWGADGSDGASNGGVGAARQRQDSAAAVLDRWDGPGRAAAEGPGAAGRPAVAGDRRPARAGLIPGVGLYAEGYTGRARMVVHEDHGCLLDVTFVGPGAECEREEQA